MLFRKRFLNKILKKSLEEFYPVSKYPEVKYEEIKLTADDITSIYKKYNCDGYVQDWYDDYEGYPKEKDRLQFNNWEDLIDKDQGCSQKAINKSSKDYLLSTPGHFIKVTLDKDNFVVFIFSRHIINYDLRIYYKKKKR